MNTPTTAPGQAAADLRRAADILQERGWHQGGYYDQEQAAAGRPIDACPVCLEGATWAAVRPDAMPLPSDDPALQVRQEAAMQLLHAHLAGFIGEPCTAVAWQDEEWVTQDLVMAHLRVAAGRAPDTAGLAEALRLLDLLGAERTGAEEPVDVKQALIVLAKHLVQQLRDAHHLTETLHHGAAHWHAQAEDLAQRLHEVEHGPYERAGWVNPAAAHRCLYGQNLVGGARLRVTVALQHLQQFPPGVPAPGGALADIVDNLTVALRQLEAHRDGAEPPDTTAPALGTAGQATGAGGEL